MSEAGKLATAGRTGCRGDATCATLNATACARKPRRDAECPLEETGEVNQVGKAGTLGDAREPFPTARTQKTPRSDLNRRRRANLFVAVLLFSFSLVQDLEGAFHQNLVEHKPGPTLGDEDSGRS